jgi:TrpR-related protein YerC/YecD
MSLITSNKAQALYKALLSLRDEEECKKFLRDLLTDAEFKELTNRWKVAHLLDQKIPYTKIEKQTGMSSATIARINKALNNGMQGYRLALDRMDDKELPASKASEKPAVQQITQPQQQPIRSKPQPTQPKPQTRTIPLSPEGGDIFVASHK